MSVSFEECKALVDSLKVRQNAPPKRWEMSSETLRQIEAAIPRLESSTDRRTALWGIPLTVNESVPDGEIKPIYA